MARRWRERGGGELSYRMYTKKGLEGGTECKGRVARGERVGGGGGGKREK